MSLAKSKSQINKILTQLVDDSSKNININSTKSEQAACCFTLGQKLIDKLLYFNLDIKQQSLNIELEEKLRNELTFVNISDGPYKSIFCLWKQTLIILLGVFFGIALTEGLGLSGAWTAIGAGIGASLSLLLKTFMEKIKNKSSNFVAFGKSISYKSSHRIFKILLIATIILVIMRDFFQQNPFLQIWLDSLNMFFVQGSALALWSNIYNVIIMLILFSLSITQKIELDVDEFKNRLFLASLTWWTVAIKLKAVITQDNNEGEEQFILGKIIKDIYLFANELPLKQQKWLIEHLNMLNVKIDCPQGELIWSDDLSSDYETIGYLEEGDACYVDTPALWKNEKLIIKGTMRKIR